MCMFILCRWRSFNIIALENHALKLTPPLLSLFQRCPINQSLTLTSAVTRAMRHKLLSRKRGQTCWQPHFRSIFPRTNLFSLVWGTDPEQIDSTQKMVQQSLPPVTLYHPWMVWCLSLPSCTCSHYLSSFHVLSETCLTFLCEKQKEMLSRILKLVFSKESKAAKSALDKSRLDY